MGDVPLLDEIIQRCQIPTYTALNPLTLPRPIANKDNPLVREPEKLHPRNSGKKLTGTLPTVAMPKLRGYEMIAEVGIGTLGAVFLAKSETTGQHVAVKVVPIRTAATELLRRKFLAEIDHVAQARNPNMVSLVERGTVGQAFYFVTEYCGGGNLAQWMESSGGKLKSVEIRPVMQQCLEALKHAHLHRLVHGNITPQNILFASAVDPRVAKISDFALAKEFGQKFSSRPTQAVDFHAAGFMPRERLTSEHGLNSRSDLWSLAAVFYHALTGSYPWDFRGRDPRDVIPREDPTPLREREETVPASVARVIDRALRPNPAQRYQTASEMKAAWDMAF